MENSRSAMLRVAPKLVPPLHESFRPAVLGNRFFLDAVRASGAQTPLTLGLEGNNGSISVFKTMVFDPKHPDAGANLMYAERLVKTLIWQRGGWKIIVGGPKTIGEHVKAAYSPGGIRAFDAELMGSVYERPFAVEITDAGSVPPPRENSMPLGRHFNGCRIGFDAGASDMKVAAVIDGKAVFSEEVVWDPKGQRDPRYHFDHVMRALKSAASHMPRVDAIGVSAAGIYINNRVMVASIFRGVPKDVFEKKARNMFLDIQKEWNGIPFQVANDGEVTALAGAMTLDDTRVLGMALGSSEAGGYVNSEGNITEWLNELAFVPVDFSEGAPVDEWSGDAGCGAQYFSQVSAVRLAQAGGIALGDSMTPPEKLKRLQDLLEKKDERAARVFESIGCYMGYGIANYADYYDLKHVLILGRVTSGRGGEIILQKAREVLAEEFPALAGRTSLHLPGESDRRMGQAIAAASLPVVG